MNTMNSIAKQDHLTLGRDRISQERQGNEATGGQTSLLVAALPDYTQSADGVTRAGRMHASSWGTLITVNELKEGVADRVIKLRRAHLLDNDRGTSEASLSVTAVNAAAGGGVSFDVASGAIVFTPVANFNGLTTFGYTASDGLGRQLVGATAYADDASVVWVNRYVQRVRGTARDRRERRCYAICSSFQLEYGVRRPKTPSPARLPN